MALIASIARERWLLQLQISNIAGGVLFAVAVIAGERDIED